MNTSQLKRFAKEARIKLINQVGRKLEFVLTHDTAELRGKQNEITQLKQKIQEQSKDNVIETVAYTWFNRLMALRFMDANGYTIPKIVTPLPGMTNPEILQNALAGNIEEDLKVDRQRINDLLDGRTANADAHTEAYKMLLVATCNYWHTTMPFMFERISDYTELLLPDDLLSDYSIVADIRSGMNDEDCQQEELIGWLYQFYISDKKDEVFNGLKKNIKITAENIPAATQLFTPRWIVRYMVENTLGKLWLNFKPNSSLRQFMPYYIETPEGNAPISLPEGITGITDITFLDPCQGSGHVLVYAFDLLTKIYEEEGYNTNEIPSLILQNNLFGFDIDERAAQLAAFALTMKARSYYSRFLRKPVKHRLIALKVISADIIKQAIKLPMAIGDKLVYDYQELSLYNLTFTNYFGSLIQIEQEEVKALQIQIGSMWEGQEYMLKEQAQYLSQQYCCVVTNPPYMGSNGMNETLKKFLDKHYTQSRSDLMTCFMQRAMTLCSPKGFWGMINLPSWMFLSTFEKFRKKLIIENKFDSMLHLGRGIFGSDFGSVAFTMHHRTPQASEKGVYRRLFQEHVQVRAVETIRELFFEVPYGYYESNQKDFEKIPGSPIGYWVGPKFIDAFKKFRPLKEKVFCIQGIITGNTEKFLRLWSEVSISKVQIDSDKFIIEKYWITYTKGGEQKKWFGNNSYVINWRNKGQDLVRSRNTNSTYYLKPCLTWTLVTSAGFTARYCNDGFLWDVSGSIGFPNKEEEMNFILSILCSKVSSYCLKLLNPTINTNIENIEAIPIPDLQDNKTTSDINLIAKSCIEISKNEWNSHETSWDFKQNELVKTQKKSISQALELYKIYWTEKFFELHRNEEKLNSHFINIYSLQGELTPEVLLEDITILQEEANIKDDKIVIECTAVLLQLISYSVGCLFGRYSIDRTGFVLATQGDTLHDFLKQVPNPSFIPNDDNILVVLDDEWFNEDIVGRFKAFLKSAFDEMHFEENMKFIEDNINKDIQKYFVKDFYNDHIKRYKKRPIYWMFSSPKGYFKALIYMHRYQPDLCSKMLNDYLQPFINKLEGAKQSQTMFSLREDISTREKALALKEIDRLDVMLKDCREYERTLFTVATQKITIDLDDGVKVNYQKFKDVLVPIKGLEKEEE